MKSAAHRYSARKTKAQYNHDQHTSLQWLWRRLLTIWQFLTVLVPDSLQHVPITCDLAQQCTSTLQHVSLVKWKVLNLFHPATYTAAATGCHLCQTTWNWPSQVYIDIIISSLPLKRVNCILICLQPSWQFGLAWTALSYTVYCTYRVNFDIRSALSMKSVKQRLLSQLWQVLRPIT